MVHTTAESKGRAATAQAQELGQPRVLVVAYPDLASAVYEALGLAPPLPAPAAAGTSVACTVSGLCSQLFPARPHMPPPQPADNGARKVSVAWLFGAGNQASATTAKGLPVVEESPGSLFEWGDYDFVIIQDMWADCADSGAPTLEPAGYELAHLDYYVRGNFNTKKIILVTDDEFLVRKWKHKDSGEQDEVEEVDFRQIVHKAFDGKDAFPLVNLNHPDAFVRLRKAVFDDKKPDTNVRDGTAAPPPMPDADTLLVKRDAVGPDSEFRSRVKKQIVEALSRYTTTRAEMVFIDDELEELRNTFREVTGVEVNVGSGSGMRALQNSSVLVVDAGRRTVEHARTLKQLVEMCQRRFVEALEGGHDYVLFVTDILFKLTSWEQTGIDLIQQLRERLSHNCMSCFGIVAFTGFTTPFIVMSSYQRGADFVVPKIIRGRHDVGTAGTDRLLMTLATLCFQKSFLRTKRSEARLCNSSGRSARASSDEFARSLRHLQAVIPQHSVSIHLQQEWLDTCYLLDAMMIYKPGSPALERVIQEVSEKHDL